MAPRRFSRFALKRAIQVGASSLLKCQRPARTNSRHHPACRSRAASASCPAPVFISSGQGAIPLAVYATSHGARGFIEKPFDADTVVERVREAIAAQAQRAGNGSGDLLTAHFPGHGLLTPREREVLVQIANGASNKEAGRKLGISPRTIEVHRARIMEKLGAKNAADLVRIVLKDGRD